ncbi:hypothetical protein EDB83DRAFT_2523239 [Lactarius deliciosus]|nr:hypothetical protein EDB83DRAFT_2523239 [Lactarius deliciosus]
MTFTKAIFAASLAAVVIAAPAAQPGNEANKVPERATRLIRAVEPRRKRNHIPLKFSADLKLRIEHLQHADCHSLVLISAPQHDARAFQTSARTRLLADERERGLRRPVEWA